MFDSIRNSVRESAFKYWWKIREKSISDKWEIRSNGDQKKYEEGMHSEILRLENRFGLLKNPYEINRMMDVKVKEGILDYFKEKAYNGAVFLTKYGITMGATLGAFFVINSAIMPITAPINALALGTLLTGSAMKYQADKRINAKNIKIIREAKKNFYDVESRIFNSLLSNDKNAMEYLNVYRNFCIDSGDLTLGVLEKFTRERLMMFKSFDAEFGGNLMNELGPVLRRYSAIGLIHNDNVDDNKSFGKNKGNGRVKFSQEDTPGHSSEEFGNEKMSQQLMRVAERGEETRPSLEEQTSPFIKKIRAQERAQGALNKKNNSQNNDQIIKRAVGKAI